MIKTAWNKGKKCPQFSGNKSHFFKHGMRGTRFYITWRNLKRRCINPKDNVYKWYGGRGIKCMWKSFEEFRDDMYESYQSHIQKFGEHQTTIDRIDHNGNYCKENCRWATRIEQARNRRDRRTITFKGETKHLNEWALEVGINCETLYERIHKHHWKIEEALTKPKQKNQFG